MDDLEDRAKLELSTNIKRLELLANSLSTAKAEISELRSKNLEMEKKLIESSIVLATSTWVGSEVPGPGKKLRTSAVASSGKHPRNSPDDDFSSGETDGEEEYLHEGMEELRAVVRERY